MSLAKPHECRLADGDLIALDMKRRDGTVFVVRCSEPAEPPSLEAMESPPHEPVATEPLPQQPVRMLRHLHAANALVAVALVHLWP